MTLDTTRDRAREILIDATSPEQTNVILAELADAGIQLAGPDEVAVQREALERAILQCIDVARGVHARGDRFRSDAILGAVHMLISMIDNPVEPWEQWRDRMYAEPRTRGTGGRGDG